MKDIYLCLVPAQPGWAVLDRCTHDVPTEVADLVENPIIAWRIWPRSSNRGELDFNVQPVCVQGVNTEDWGQPILAPDGTVFSGDGVFPDKESFVRYHASETPGQLAPSDES